MPCGLSLTPSATVWIPVTAGAFWRSQAGDDGAEEMPQFLLQVHKWRRLKGWRIAAQEATPKASIHGDGRENFGQAHGHLGWKGGFPAPERATNRFDQARQIEAKSARGDPDVVEVLDSAVRLSEADHRLEFFGDHGFGWIHQDVCLRQIWQQAREISSLW